MTLPSYLSGLRAVACVGILLTLLSAAQACGGAADPELLKLVIDEKAEMQERDGAVKMLAKTKEGAQALIDSAAKGDFPEELRSSAGFALAESEDAGIRESAAKALPLPKMKDGVTILPISQLVLKTGDAKAGGLIFRSTTGPNCINCHQIENEGKDVGPPLNTIGEKPKEVLYESILAPSAAIQHGFEAYSIRTIEGNVLTGIKIEDSDEKFTLKNLEGEYVDIPVARIKKKLKQQTSMMPENLIGSMTTQELIDLVEYMAKQKVQ